MASGYQARILNQLMSGLRPDLGDQTTLKEVLGHSRREVKKNSSVESKGMRLRYGVELCWVFLLDSFGQFKNFFKHNVPDLRRNDRFFHA